MRDVLRSTKVDPKPGNETAGKLSSASGCDPLDGKRKEGTNAQKGSHGRADHPALRQAEAGKKVGDICRELGVSQQAFYSWKRHFTGLGLTELRELRQLQEETRKLKTLVADLMLDKHILQEVLSKKA